MTPILSICIPCYGRVEYVRKTLNSIFNDNKDVPLTEYEVIISDNDPNKEIKPLIKEFNHPNLRYFSTECEGFLNSYYVLTYGKGELLMLHNGQTMFRKGALSFIIQNIKRVSLEKPLIFYTNGLLEEYRQLNFNDFESYMFKLSYWSSWSDGFTIWKSKFENLKDIRLKLNKLFPQTSLFLTQYNSTHFIIDDYILFNGQRIPKRGGHNKFAAFTIDYPSLITQCYQEHKISEKCRNHILKDIMHNFLPQLYFNKYIARTESFDSSEFKKNLRRFFPKYAYGFIIISSLFQPLKTIKRKLKRIGK